MASNFWSTAELIAALLFACVIVYPVLCLAISGSIPLRQLLEGLEPKAHASELS
ncbi:MAG: hypothetical protein AAGH78_03270 [Cyanobacteria bacterium P01_H01_bin.58]